MPAPDVLALASSLEFVDEVYAQFLTSPDKVDPSWRRIFEAAPDMIAPAAAPAIAGAVAAAGDARKLLKVFTLVRSYRVRGHLEADLDPLAPGVRHPYPELDPRTYGFTDEDLDKLIVPSGTIYGLGDAPLREVISRLRATYCRHVGVEFMHIAMPSQRAWLEERMERSLNATALDKDTRIHILEKLIAAEVLERFINEKYVGSKRFSIEGAETLLPLLDLAVERAGRQGASEIVLGMAHRGRLNVLANLLSEDAQRLFEDFEDLDPQSVMGGGDVKYHLGKSLDKKTRLGDQLHLSLTPNPSHLEAVDPVVVGRVRAKQQMMKDEAREKVLGILVHGDAAFAGQGLVPETFGLSQLIGYRTGGTFHCVVNNQIGFTTSSTSSRSSPYPTDHAKAFQAPVFHVNGDDPDAVAHVVGLAMEFRREFRSDVVVDMFCFRRHGHNEMDEPSFTQPLLYKEIERHPPVWRLYGDTLIRDSVTTADDIQAMVAEREKKLEVDLASARKATKRSRTVAFRRHWSGFEGGAEPTDDPQTGLGRERVQQIGGVISTLPQGFAAHPKIVKLLEGRAAMARGERPFDWGTAELVAMGSVALEGKQVRLSGQDCRRGTFSQRHAVAVDVTNGNEHYFLHHLAPDQAPFRVYDSMLSEVGVLGFEFGYSLDTPDGLVIWEAQFGDFANGAQVIIDQFVSSSEDKWQRRSGLVMFLPHGYEGQGPEHSSARYERYLQLCAEDCMQVVYPTTPAQHFHLLRRQAVRPWKKPLVVLTPKSLLRDPRATSPLDALAQGRFEVILDDPAPPPAERVTRVLLCTGKVYYDLAEERKKRDDRATAIVRIEQLYPWREEALKQVLARYPNATSVRWAQEEPANMGALFFVMPRVAKLMPEGKKLDGVSRPESASPATGSAKAHAIELRLLLEQAFDGGGR